jgi:hypothetical protein
MLRPRLLSLLTALSLLLCVVAVALGAWSYRRVDCLSHFGRMRDLQLVSAKGRLSLRVISYSSPRNRSAGSSGWQLFAGPPNLSLASPPQTIWSRLGFFGNTFPGRDGSYEYRTVTFPWAAVTVTSAVPPVLSASLGLKRHWTSRRRRAGQCRCCGYNLTGNVSGVCPECGHPTSGNAPTAAPIAQG